MDEPDNCNTSENGVNPQRSAVWCIVLIDCNTSENGVNPQQSAILSLNSLSLFSILLTSNFTLRKFFMAVSKMELPPFG